MIRFEDLKFRKTAILLVCKTQLIVILSHFNPLTVQFTSSHPLLKSYFSLHFCLEALQSFQSISTHIESQSTSIKCFFRSQSESPSTSHLCKSFNHSAFDTFLPHLNIFSCYEKIKITKYYAMNLSLFKINVTSFLHDLWQKFFMDYFIILKQQNETFSWSEKWFLHIYCNWNVSSFINCCLLWQYKYCWM